MVVQMKRIIFSVVMIFGFIVSFTVCNADAGSHIIYRPVNVYDRTKYSTITEYSCNFNKVWCNVGKVKLLQTGRTYYDAECSGSHMEQGKFRHRAESDVRLRRFDYCTITSKSIGG